MALLCINCAFPNHGLVQGENESKKDFLNRIIAATRGDYKWHRCYTYLVDQCFEQRKQFRESTNHLHFRGHDRRLQFNPARVPPNFDIEQSLFIVELQTIGGVPLLSLTSQFSEDSFFYSTSNGHYVSMVNREWFEKIGGSLQALLDCALFKLGHIPS